MSIVNQSRKLVLLLLPIKLRRREQIKQVAAQESKKYSSRSPTACRWTLGVSNFCRRGYGDNSQPNYCIVIKTNFRSRRRKGAHYSSNHINESSHLIEQQNNDTPPPYSNSPLTFCSQCGEIRQNSSPRFCSSCGQAFH